MNANYTIHAEYNTKGIKDIFKMDDDLFQAIGESSDGSGLGIGMRDHDFSKNSKQEAEDLAEKIGNFFLANNIEYTIDVEKV